MYNVANKFSALTELTLFCIKQSHFYIPIILYIMIKVLFVQATFIVLLNAVSEL